MVDGPDGPGGWYTGGKNPWHTSRRCRQPGTGESLPALCVRSLEGADAPGASVVWVCRRRTGALPNGARGADHPGRPPDPSGGMPAGAASDEDQDRLLQGWPTHGEIPDPEVRLPRVYLSAEAGEKLQAEQYVLELHPGRQRDGAHEHAADDPGAELSQADPEHTGGSSIPSFYTLARVSVITRDCCRISAYRWMRGVSLCSGMLGIRS